MSRETLKPTTSLARRSVTRRRVANPGVTKLRKDADEVVLKNSEVIAKSLGEEAVKGNASSARLLVDLAQNANWVEQSDSVAEVMSLARNGWKADPPVIELQLTTNPPKLKPGDPRQLTDGASEIPDAEVVEDEPKS